MSSDPTALPPAIDPAALANLRSIGGNADDFVREMVQIFGEDSPPRIAEIADRLARGEAGLLAKSAHSLKGSAVNFGAQRFRGLAEKIEFLGKTGDLAAIPPVLAELRAEYGRVIAALEAAVKRGG